MNTTPSQASLNHITGIVLAGGEGRRMGGVDKGLLTLGDRSLLEHVLTRLAPQVGPLCIVANRSLPQYEAIAGRFGGVVVRDEPHWQGQHEGPLAGFRAGLRTVVTPLALLVPVDAVQLPVDLASRLLSAGAPSQVSRMPVCALLSRAQLPALEAAFIAGERSPQRWLRQQQVTEVEFADWHERGRSLNTPEEWQQLQRLFSGPLNGLLKGP